MENNDIEMIKDILENESKTPESIQPVECQNRSSTGLSLLAQYSGTESSDEESEQKEVIPPVVQIETYRTAEKVEESSSSCSSGSDDDIQIIERKIRQPVVESDDSDEEGGIKKKKREPLKVKGEFLLGDLPPIEDLQIQISEGECVEIGAVSSIVDQLVLVDAFPNSPPLDIDSVLFLDAGKQPLGKVFDVIGPINLPIYCIRFNSHEQIISKGITKGTKVYCAPRSEYSSFVILSKIMTKGSDSSWKNDIETPEGLQDCSDDEQERRNKKGKKNNNTQNAANVEQQRPFIRGYRQNQHHQNGGQNLAYPNYSWHHNMPGQNGPQGPGRNQWNQFQ